MCCARIALCLGISVVSLGCLAADLAAAAGIELQATPSKVELSADEYTSAFVIVTNGGTSKASHLRLAPLTAGSSPAHATVTPAGKSTLKPGESRTYHLEIASWGSARPPAPLSLLATFVTGAGVRHAVSTSLELTPPAPIDVDEIASVEVKASLATLRSDQTQPVYLLVKNNAAQELTVKEVDASSKPSFIEFRERPQNVKVAPGETSVLTLQAHAKSRVKPGEHQLVFRLRSSMGGSNFDLVGSQTAKVGVEGETELLTIFGIPSLLLLPGFLVLATASLLWRLRLARQEWDGEDFPFPLKEGEFWVLAVLSSIAIVLAARLIGIDLLGEYGLEDVVILWLASMGIGLVLYLPLVIARNRSRAARVPNSSDKPIAILRKLAKQGLRLELPFISLDTGVSTEKRFVLQPLSDSRPSTWVSPRILYTWTNNVDDELNRRINEQIDESQDAAALADSFAKGEQRGLLTVKFSRDASPTLEAKEKISVTGNEQLAGEA